MDKPKYQKSRRVTPWDGDVDLTSTQEFLKQYYDANYANHHRNVGDSGEADMINSYIAVKCPICESMRFKKNGYTSSAIQRYMCECGKTFLPTTGTIFDERKI